MKLSNKVSPEIVTFPSQLGLERHSMDQHVYNEYLAILREEIVPALGCTLKIRQVIRNLSNRKKGRCKMLNRLTVILRTSSIKGKIIR